MRSVRSSSVVLCALFFALLHPGGARAQGDVQLALLRPVPSLRIYEGTYVAGRDTLRIRADEGRLGLTVQGAQALMRLASHAERGARVEACAARVLDGWVQGDFAPTAAVLPEAQRAQGVAFMQGLVHVVADRYGPVRAYRLLGTHHRPDGQAETIVALGFSEAQPLLLRLVWDAGAAPRLLRVARGASPVSLGHAQPASGDQFRLPNAQVAFRRGGNDGITSVTLRDTAGAMTFRRLSGRGDQ